MSVTNLRVLSGIHLTLVALLQKMCLKECEVSEVLADCHTRFAVVLSLPSCCVSSLLFRSQNDIYFSDEREFSSVMVEEDFNILLKLVIAIAKCRRAKILPIRVRCLICLEMCEIQ